MGDLGLSALTAVKHFWYLHNAVNYCSAGALAKCPASCERSCRWHWLCSPRNRANLGLGNITAAEKWTYSEEILTYEVKEGTKMPRACGCPGCATEFGADSSFPVLEMAAHVCEHQLIYGHTEEETLGAGRADLCFCGVINQLIFLQLFFLCVQLTREHQVALSSITYIGCALSIFCLTITLVTFAILSWVILT